jgi:hypothetical protein
MVFEVTSVSTCCLLFERPLWEFVGYCVEQGLFCGLSSSQGVGVDLSGLQIDLGSDEAMNPVAVDWELVAEQAGLSSVVGAANVDQGSLRMFLQIQTPAFRERSPRGSRFDSRGNLLPCGGDVLVGSASETAEGVVLESRPDVSGASVASCTAR